MSVGRKLVTSFAISFFTALISSKTFRNRKLTKSDMYYVMATTSKQASTLAHSLFFELLEM